MSKVNPDLDYIVGWLGVIDMKGLNKINKLNKIEEIKKVY
jgi:hypothetical protein